MFHFDRHIRQLTVIQTLISAWGTEWHSFYNNNYQKQTNDFIKFRNEKLKHKMNTKKYGIKDEEYLEPTEVEKIN